MVAAAAAADDNVASHASQPGQAGRRGEICRNRRVLGGVGEREGEGESLWFADASLLKSVDIWRPHCREGGREEGKAREREREKGRERDKI